MGLQVFSGSIFKLSQVQLKKVIYTERCVYQVYMQRVYFNPYFRN